jgi:hypothetical protein
MFQTISMQNLENFGYRETSILDFKFQKIENLGNSN